MKHVHFSQAKVTETNDLDVLAELVQAFKTLNVGVETQQMQTLCPESIQETVFSAR